MKSPDQSKDKTCCSKGHVYDEVGFCVINPGRKGEHRRCNRCHADRAIEWRRQQKEKGIVKPKRELTEREREMARERNRRYREKLEGDKVEVWCDFCQETHSVASGTYKKNLERNGGVYICGKYGPHLAGKRRKPQPKEPGKPLGNISLDEAKANTCVADKDIAEFFGALGGVADVFVWDVSDQDVVEKLHFGIPSGGIHLFSDELARRKEQCIGFILAHAGMFDRRVGARKCEVKEVQKKEAVEFLNAFHIQGANRLGVIYFGLYQNDELLGLMSLGRHSRTIAQNRVVLDRLCFRAGVHVVGGASKLLKIAAKWAKGEGYDEIVTFSDDRWTDGQMYEKIGFDLEQRLNPDYSYVKDGRRYSKQSQRKKATNCPEGMTEFEWATHRGLKRIYDAGKKRWIMNLNPGEHKTRNELSSKRAKDNNQHAKNRIHGYFKSEKNGCSIYYASSYELRCMFLLEGNDEVAAFGRCEPFSGKDGLRNPDLQVEFTDGQAEILEIKPEKMLKEKAVQEQIRDSEEFAKSRGIVFRVWTEKDSGFDCSAHITSWAREYLASIGEPKFSEQKKKARKRIQVRRYKKTKADKVSVWCDFCKETHVQLRMTYEQNLKRNDGKYICGKYGGHLAGKKPKLHLRKTNEYAAEGKKQCSTCHEIRPLEDFPRHKTTFDGLNPRCRECWRKKRAEKKAKDTMEKSVS